MPFSTWNYHARGMSFAFSNVTSNILQSVLQLRKVRVQRWGHVGQDRLVVAVCSPVFVDTGGASPFPRSGFWILKGGWRRRERPSEKSLHLSRYIEEEIWEYTNYCIFTALPSDHKFSLPESWLKLTYCMCLQSLHFSPTFLVRTV